MSVVFHAPKKAINDRRRENKKRSDLSKKRTFKHEVNCVFNKFYKDQVTALYREVRKGM